MKKYWKIAAFALALVLVFTACGGPQEEAQDTQGQESETVENADNDENETENDGEKLTIEDGVLKVGTSADFAPFEYVENGEITGIDVDIIKAVGEKMGLDVQVQDMNFKAILASLGSGKIDAGVAAISVTEERKQSVDFSDPYAQTILKIMVAKDSDIKGPEDLEGKKIGAQLGTTGEAYAKDDFGEENVQSFDKYYAAVQALANGKVDAVIMDAAPAKNYADASDLKLLDTAYAEEEYSIAFTKGNKALVDAANKALKELKEDGTIDSILEKYIHE